MPFFSPFSIQFSVLRGLNQEVILFMKLKSENFDFKNSSELAVAPNLFLPFELT